MLNTSLTFAFALLAAWKQRIVLYRVFSSFCIIYLILILILNGKLANKWPTQIKVDLINTTYNNIIYFHHALCLQFIIYTHSFFVIRHNLSHSRVKSEATWAPLHCKVETMSCVVYTICYVQCSYQLYNCKFLSFHTILISHSSIQVIIVNSDMEKTL